MKDIGMSDIKMMFLYIKRNKKSLKELLKSIECNYLAAKKYDALKKAAIEKVLSQNEYYFDSYWEKGESERVYNSDDAFMLNDKDFDIVYLSAYELIKNSPIIKNKFVVDAEKVHVVNYGHKYRERAKILEEELIGKFEKFTDLKKEQFLCDEDYNEYMDWIKSAINRK